MRVIHKYVLETVPEQTVTITGYRKILTLQKQVEKPVMYAEVDAEDPTKTEFSVSMRGTGMERPDKMYEYLGTFSSNGYVWHYYTCITGVDYVV